MSAKKSWKELLSNSIQFEMLEMGFKKVFESLDKNKGFINPDNIETLLKANLKATYFLEIFRNEISDKEKVDEVISLLEDAWDSCTHNEEG